MLPDAARGAHIVLPLANVAEENGTFVNRDGRVQCYRQARSAPGMARPAWWVLGELAAALGVGDAPASAADAFDMLAAEVEAFGGLSHSLLGLHGALLGRRAPAGATA
jgi:NADH-quinone oxidoreductase subunit G